MATTKYRFPDDDPHATDLQLLALKKATFDVLQECPSLLRLVPVSLISASAPTVERARALLAVLREVIDRAFLARQADIRDARAGRVLAAGTLIGLVTDQPEEAEQLPSKTARDRTMNKGDRQEQAAVWLVDASPGDRRRFADYEPRCLDSLRHDVIDLLADEEAVRSLVDRIAVRHSSIGPTERFPSNIATVLTVPIEDVAASDDSTADRSGDQPIRIATTDSDEPAPNQMPSGGSHLRRNVLIGIMSVVVLAGVAVGTWALTYQSGSTGSGSSDQGTHNAGPLAGAPSTTTTTQSAPFIAGKTYREQEGHLGTYVYSDPSTLSAVGRLQPLQKVQVTCKVLDPSMGSVNPDGYWYRISGGQWNNDYAIANTFLNGDPIVGTSNGPQHNTDFNVTDCPATN